MSNSSKECLRVDTNENETQINTKLEHNLKNLIASHSLDQNGYDQLRYVLYNLNENKANDFLAKNQNGETFIKIVLKYIRLTWGKCTNVKNSLSSLTIFDKLDNANAKFAQNLEDILLSVVKATINLKSFCQLLNETSESVDTFFSILNGKDATKTKIKKADEDKMSKIQNIVRSTLCILLNMSQSISNTNRNFYQFSDTIKDQLKQKQNFNFEKLFLFLINENLSAIQISNKSENHRLYNSQDASTFFDIEDKSDPLKKKIHSMNYIKFLLESNSVETILNEDCSWNAFFFCRNVPFDEMSEHLQADYVQILINSFTFFFKNFVDLIKIEKVSSNSKNKEKDLKQTMAVQKFLEIILTIIVNFTNESAKFCIAYHQTNEGIKVLFEYIQNETIFDCIINNRSKKSSLVKLPTENYGDKDQHVDIQALRLSYELCMGTLHNLSRFSYKFKNVWTDLNAVDSCIKLSENIPNEQLQMKAYTILANIASDDQINNLKEIKTVVKAISDLIKECTDSLAKKPERVWTQLNENEEAVEISVLEGWHLVELIEAIYNLAVNDNLKLEIFNFHLTKEYFRKLISKGNEAECEYALKLLYQLCFDKTVVESLTTDKELVALIANILQRHDLKRKQLRNNCEGILWKLGHKQTDRANDSDKAKKAGEEAENRSHSESQRHFMISYNRESRDTCLMIKKELEDWGFKVWIDVDNISGSSLESMANAIEQSHCVLMAMTEKYKLSTYCRLEAEYTITLNKPIIPLILQSNYMPDGWLGIILGSKIFINFKKYDFVECIRRLKSEVSNVTKIVPPKIQIESNAESKKQEIKEAPKKEVASLETVEAKRPKSKLTMEEVEKWASDKNFHPHITNSFKNCNGKTLYHVYLMLVNSPDFFYKTMHSESNNTIRIKDLAQFASELHSLFEE